MERETKYVTRIIPERGGFLRLIPEPIWRAVGGHIYNFPAADISVATGNAEILNDHNGNMRAEITVHEIK